DGENRYHAVFTKGHKCVIVHPSTLAPALIALDASVTIIGGGRPTSMKLAAFFHAPKSADERETVLKPNQMVTTVVIPFASDGLKNASYEVRHKQSHDWSLVQAAVAFNLDKGKATNVKIVLGHAAPTPLMATAAMKAMEGKEV